MLRPLMPMQQLDEAEEIQRHLRELLNFAKN